MVVRRGLVAVMRRTRGTSIAAAMGLPRRWRQSGATATTPSRHSIFTVYVSEDDLICLCVGIDDDMRGCLSFFVVV